VKPRAAPLPSYPPPCTGAPPDAVVELVGAHLGKVLPAVLNEVLEWTAKQRLRAARLLHSVALLAETNLVAFADHLLATLCRVRLDDDAAVANKIKEVVFVVGHFVDPDTYLPRTLPNLSPRETIPATLRAGTAAVVKELLEASGSAISAHIGEVAAALQKADAVNMEDAACQRRILELAEVAIVGAGASCHAVALPLCSLAAGIQVAAEGTESAEKARSLEVRLARAVQAEDVSALWSQHYSALLGSIAPGCGSWAHSSAEARLFALLVRRSGGIVLSGGAGKPTLDVCVRCCNVQKDARLRALMLGLLADVLSSKGSDRHSGPMASTFAAQCALPNCTWRAGAMAAQARLHAVRLLAVLVRNHPVKHIFLPLLPAGLLTTLLSVLEEEESKTRLLVCQTLSTLFPLLEDSVPYQELRSALPEVMKRLDDSRDAVRLAALDTVIALSAPIVAQGCDSYLTYVVDAVLVYLEDADKAMREKAEQALRHYAKFEPLKFEESVRKYLQRGVTKAADCCQELIEYARLLHSDKSDIPMA